VVVIVLLLDVAFHVVDVREVSLEVDLFQYVRIFAGHVSRHIL
jgi:hypothetical protein